MMQTMASPIGKLEKTTSPKGLAVFVSGSGTNLQALIDACQSGELEASIKLVVADNACYGLERAKAAGIETLLMDRKQLKVLSESERASLWSEVILKLQAAGVSLIVLAGYLSIVPEALVAAFPDAIVNLHPSLIPKYCGKGFYGMKVHEAVIAAGETQSGISIHFVDGGIDTGKIIRQVTVAVEPQETPESLAEKIHKLEHEHLKAVIKTLL